MIGRYPSSWVSEERHRHSCLEANVLCKVQPDLVCGAVSLSRDRNTLNTPSKRLLELEDLGVGLQKIRAELSW